MRASTMLTTDPLQGATCIRCADEISPGQRFVPVDPGEPADWSRVAHESCEREVQRLHSREHVQPSAPESAEFRPIGHFARGQS